MSLLLDVQLVLELGEIQVIIVYFLTGFCPKTLRVSQVESISQINREQMNSEV